MEDRCRRAPDPTATIPATTLIQVIPGVHQRIQVTGDSVLILLNLGARPGEPPRRRRQNSCEFSTNASGFEEEKVWIMKEGFILEFEEEVQGHIADQVVAGAGNGNSISKATPSSQRATPISEATLASQDATPTSQDATPISEGEDTWDASIAEAVGEEDEAMKLYNLYFSSRPTVPTASIHAELDMYLEEASLPRTQELDIINLWKVSGSMFPTLQKLARDILPIPITYVALECAFITSGRVLSAHRSRLAPNVAASLMCMQAWSRADLLGGWNSTLFATFQSVLEDDEEEMDESTSIITQE